MQSCARRLEPCRVSLLLLNASRNFGEGVMLSISIIFLPCAVLLQPVFHFSMIVVAWCCFSAAECVVSLCLRRGGRSFLSEVVPCAAALASLSASSLPAIPQCPAVQRNISEYFEVWRRVWICVARRMM